MVCDEESSSSQNIEGLSRGILEILLDRQIDPSMKRMLERSLVHFIDILQERIYIAI